MANERTPLRTTTVAELAADVAHTVNNPLSAIFAGLEVVTSWHAENGTPDMAPALEALKDVFLAAERIRAVIDHMSRECVPGTKLVPPSGPPSPTATTPSGAFAVSPGLGAGLGTGGLGSGVDKTVRVRVLIVDDEEVVGRLLRRILRDYDVVALASPREALARIEGGERFDFVLCDLTMEEMSGDALFAKIHAASPEQAARVVFMTGGATTDEGRRFLATTKQRVLGKPFDTDELRALIREATKKRS